MDINSFEIVAYNLRNNCRETARCNVTSYGGPCRNCLESLEIAIATFKYYLMSTK